MCHDGAGACITIVICKNVVEPKIRKAYYLHDVSNLMWNV